MNAIAPQDGEAQTLPKDDLRYLCDTARHLICIPYSIENLHRMARALGIKRCWFHKDHYDIPKTRIAEITAKCEVVSSRQIVEILRPKV
jgi:FMN phosphatase YigB (HAD superfamily)